MASGATSKNRRRLWIAACVAAALVVSAGAGILWARQMQACAPNAANAEAAPDQAGPATGTPALIIGDSYTTGWGLEQEGDSWAYQTADSLDLAATVEGFPGTGYVTDGACGDNSFDARLKLPSSPPPTTVIIQGGINDAIFGKEITAIDTAARALCNRIQTTDPNALLVLVGPPTLPNTPDAPTVSATLQRVANETGALYVDLSEVNFETTDGTHPDTRGHTAIAEAVISAINAAA